MVKALCLGSTDLGAVVCPWGHLLDDAKQGWNALVHRQVSTAEATLSQRTLAAVAVRYLQGLATGGTGDRIVRIVRLGASEVNAQSSQGNF